MNLRMRRGGNERAFAEFLKRLKQSAFFSDVYWQQTQPQFDPKTNVATITQAIAANGCPATYQPPKDNRFRSKLTFSFAIGQAF